MKYRIKRTCEGVWSGYCWECDRGRVDEGLALLGGLVALAVVFLLLCWITSLAGAGTSLLGVPMLCVARWAWTRRTR